MFHIINNVSTKTDFTFQLLNSDHRSTATVQICSGSVNLRGNVKCRAYIHSNRPKVKDAVQAVKRDILNTVADRCEILFEDLLLNEIPEKKIMNFLREFLFPFLDLL